ncbi:putative Tail fiber protein [Vibrio crassostreae]|nr:putative Tail fiber protein [Vibrio crassostreae]
MSTQDTAALIESVNNMTATVAGKMGEIDQKVDKATQAVPLTVKNLFDQTLYVNEATGSSDNDGLSDAKPVKWLKDAINKVPAGGKVRIIVRNNVLKFHDDWPMDGRNKQGFDVANGRTVHIDLSGHYLMINTTHWNAWAPDNLNSTNPSLDKTFVVSANSFMEIYNGSIRINPQSGDEGKSLYAHTSVSCVFNNDSSRTQLSSMTIDSTVPNVGLFGLDNWGAMGFDVHMRDTTLSGTGLLRRISNSAVANDIEIKKLNVTSTWTE